MRLIALCIVGFGIPIAAADAQAPKTKAAPAAPQGGTTVRNEASYALGVTFSKNFKARGIQLDMERLIQGIRDGMAGSEKLNDQQCEQLITAYNAEIVAQMATKNKKEGEAYLAANKGKEGVQTTKSGLQYKVAKQGGGPLPKASDTVKVHYTGKLIDGTVFDSSVDRGEPLTIGVSEVIPGWTEALQLMKVGSKLQIFIPSELGYKEQNPPGSPIGPNSVLIFDVELLGIEPTPKP
jgi:FKBP-type peptidyl-prolyl cis-trans isomerase